MTSAGLMSHEEIRRYSRHLILPEVGTTGQEKLRAARVLVIGAGGLGCPVLQYLAAAGVGHLGIVDDDHIELSNLQRQVLYRESQVGLAKVDEAATAIRGLNTNITVDTHALRLDARSALRLIADYDWIVDCTDNFGTRFLVNDACVMLGKPLVYASIYRFDGQLSVFNHDGGPCYRCLYPSPPPPDLVPSCAEGGVVGVLPGILGTLQANEVIKLILGIGAPASGRLLTFDAMDLQMSAYEVVKNATCPACGADACLTELREEPVACGIPSQADRPAPVELSPGAAQRKLLNDPSVQLVDVRSPAEYAITHIDQARLLPLDQLEQLQQSLARDRAILCYCHKGGRSRRAGEFLLSQGFTEVFNLAGGIDAWSLEVSPSTPRY